MDAHDKAHYGIAGVVALLAAGAGGLAWHANERPATPPVWSFANGNASDKFVIALKGGTPRSVRIACAADCGDLPEALGRAFDAAGWSSQSEAVIGVPAGLVVSPNTPEGQALAKLVGEATGETPKTVDEDNQGLLIVLGRHPRGQK